MMVLFQTEDEEYVLNAINMQEKGKASGPDKVTITLVQDAAISIAYPLMMIYNASLYEWHLSRCLENSEGHPYLQIRL